MADYSSVYTPEQIADCKKRFAKLLLDCPNSAIDIVFSLLQTITAVPFSVNPTYVTAFANSWPFDPEVIAEQERLLAEPLSKAKFVREVLTHARNSNLAASDRLGFYKLAKETEWGGSSTVSLGMAKNGKQTDDKLQELAAMIIFPPKVKPTEEVKE